jgi:hypothetical protein
VALALYFVYPYLMVQLGGMVTKHVENDIATSTSSTGTWLGKHIFAACNNDKPICCIAPYGFSSLPYPDDPSEPYIANGPNADGPWPASQQDRVSQEAVLKGDVDISFTGVYPSGGVKYFCMYNTRLARSYGIFANFIVASGAYSLLIGPGAQVIIGRLMTAANLNWLLVLLIPTVTAFITTSMYEIIFVLFVVSIVMPIFMIFITLTLAREIAKVLGTEIDLSALEKII